MTSIDNKILQFKMTFMHPNKGCKTLFSKLEICDNIEDFKMLMSKFRKKRARITKYDLSKCEKDYLVSLLIMHNYLVL